MIKFLKKLLGIAAKPSPRKPRKSIDFSKQWLTADGDVILHCNMHTQHVKNSVKMLLRRAGEDMELQLFELLNERITVDSSLVARVVMTVKLREYRLGNFAHEALEHLIAEYNGRYGQEYRDKFAIDLAEYEANIVAEICLRVTKRLKAAALHRAMARAAEQAGCTVEVLKQAIDRSRVGVEAFHRAMEQNGK